MAYRALEKLINLHDGYRKAVQVAGRQALLFQEAGVLRLVDRHCPHQGQVLDAAPIDKGMLICPKHQLQFSLKDGAPSPAICASLKIHDLVYEGNSVGVDE
ncbi:Rieske (2Fe-2S) protein [Congregibacter litoralis]|uniref:Ferredoxin subunit of nitrite reductase and ring-hydroxylating dioxygenase n=1 Tax=Congregibacter litoralis KT71 TaxID=314285 RepID=A4A3C5_9GAMM|nr:Rieske 2Fe-2S domain-containing protein [Congregibacter litoralis]EAQ99198.1 Ferredoxin subunit of nitrite reductase and ring-hydroxylating dioxygenase [Congregibacter litoralis KT71]